MASAAVGDQGDDIELGIKNVRRVTSSGARSVGSAQIFGEGDEGFDNNSDGRHANLEKGCACDENNVVVKEVLDSRAGAVREL